MSETGKLSEAPVTAAPGELSAVLVDKVRAVADALTRLGRDADPARVAEHVKAAQGLDLSLEEVAHIRDDLLRQAETAPGPDRPPPENAQGRPAVSPKESNPFDRSGPVLS